MVNQEHVNIAKELRRESIELVRRMISLNRKRQELKTAGSTSDLDKAALVLNDGEYFLLQESENAAINDLGTSTLELIKAEFKECVHDASLPKVR